MTRKCVNDEQYGRLWRRLNEVARRVDEGTVPFDLAMSMAQQVIEARPAPAKKRGKRSKAPVPAVARVFETKELVEKMIAAGYHRFATAPDGTVGMSAEAYRALWPATVTQPIEYAGRFDELLLVDRTVPDDKLVVCGQVERFIEPGSCKDIVSPPKDENGTPLKRYVAFVQTGAKNLGRSVADCCASFALDEVGLVTHEGLHFPVEHEPVLRHHAVDIAGSRRGEISAPYVNWFDGGRPKLSDNLVGYGDPHCGSASRGSAVIAVP